MDATDPTATMSKKDEFDALMKLADFRFKRWADRRQYEWKVSLALWAGLAGAAVVLKTTGVMQALKNAPPSLWIVLGALLLLMWVGHAWKWVFWNWKRNQADINLAFFFADTAEGILRKSNSPKPIEPLPRKQSDTNDDFRTFCRAVPCQFQIAATFILAIILGIYLFLGSQTPSVERCSAAIEATGPPLIASIDIIHSLFPFHSTVRPNRA